MDKKVKGHEYKPYFECLIPTVPIVIHSFDVFYTYICVNEKSIVHCKQTIVRVRRIELLPHPWQGRVLPLNDTRSEINIHQTYIN